MVAFPVPREMKDKSRKADRAVDLTRSFQIGCPTTQRERQRNVASGLRIGISPAHHPSQDASVVRDEVTAPYQTIGTADVPVQDISRQECRVFWKDSMALDP